MIKVHQLQTNLYQSCFLVTLFSHLCLVLSNKCVSNLGNEPSFSISWFSPICEGRNENLPAGFSWYCWLLDPKRLLVWVLPCETEDPTCEVRWCCEFDVDWPIGLKPGLFPCRGKDKFDPVLTVRLAPSPPGPPVALVSRPNDRLLVDRPTPPGWKLWRPGLWADSSWNNPVGAVLFRLLWKMKEKQLFVA